MFNTFGLCLEVIPVNYRSLGAGTHTITFSKTGYDTESLELELLNDDPATIPTSRFVLNQHITDINTWRFVLTWGKYPMNLDAYLKAQNNTYINFWYKDGVKAESTLGFATPHLNYHAELHVSSHIGYGPETITIYLDTPPIRYKYYIYNNSASPTFATSPAVVRVYNSTGLYQTFTPSSPSDSRFWYLFEIQGGTITEKHLIQGTEPIFVL